MAFLMDANCFIEPKNRYYGFDICPGFWDWIDQENNNGDVFSIDKIKVELTNGNDDLAKWAKQKDASFFLATDSAALSNLGQIGTWLTTGGIYKPHVIADFLKGADQFLIAHGLAHGHTLVTHEIHKPGEKKKVKIPTVCQNFKVPCITIFDLLRLTGAKFKLS